MIKLFFFFFSSRRRHTRWPRDWSSDVCSSDLLDPVIDPTRFAARYPFELDAFQMRAIEALHGGESVLVAAPTGSGKTVVAEFAVDRALAADRKCFYTTPLKALSNQKFGDLVARLGAAKVGLLTGDNAINGDAPIVRG